DVDLPAPNRRPAEEQPTNPPGGEEGAARVELLDTAPRSRRRVKAVAPICDVDVSAPVGRHGGGGRSELPRGALAPPGGEEGAARVELLDAAVERIRDVDVSAPVGRHAGGGGELSV